MFPVYTVELLSSWHPFFLGSPAYAELADELARREVKYRNTDLPAEVVGYLVAPRLRGQQRHCARSRPSWP